MMQRPASLFGIDGPGWLGLDDLLRVTFRAGGCPDERMT